jgi:TolB-like protein/class 3 adenylate cyclase/Tfp pilus assembly protein PilF
MRMTRKLAAIIAADVVGYSRLMGADEAGTLAALKMHRRELIDPKIAEHQGRIVKTTGDGLLIEFPSVVEAVQCAVEVQRAMQDRNTDVPADHRIEFRVGINLGDIIIDGDDIYGDGVNVAARLEGLAEANGVCVSRVVHDQVRDKLDLTFEDLGERQLKNIARPVRVFRIAAPSFAPTQSAKPALALPNKPSIAVLPFTNMSGDPEQEYFSDGITEDIITALSRLHWFFVIARNSTFAYKGKSVDVKHLGQELGVRYVLEGSVRKSGQRVRITSQLIDATTNNHIWAERYDRELSDIFALQDEITASVTAAIEPKLLAAEGIRAESRSIEDLNAWDHVARAVSHFWKLNAAESATAISMLRQAVQRYPDYAPAHSILAFALVVSAHLGWAERANDRVFATECARRAVELDDEDPWAHVALGYLAFTARRTDEAVNCFRRALDLNPNFAAAYGYIGFALACDGRSEEAIENLQRAIRMSPRDPLNFFFVGGMAAAHYQAGRYAEAVDWACQQVQLRPGSPSGHRILCASLAQAGLIEEARAAMRLLREVQPNISVAWIKESVPYPDHTMPRFLEGLQLAGLAD